jgi:hypothetical protein
LATSQRIEGRGTILYQCKNGEHIALPNVYYIPHLDTNIISIGQLDGSNYEIKIHCGVMQILAEDGCLLTRIRRGPTRLYTLDLHITQLVCLAAKVREEAWRWHARYGHVNFTALRKMAAAALVRGLSRIEQVDQLCEACLAGKQKHALFPQRATRRATRSLELLRGDLCGPITPTTPSG